LIAEILGSNIAPQAANQQKSALHAYQDFTATLGRVG
jgi:hypothetical protein